MTRIDIISGFLGAGKTTLIKKLLGDALKGQQVVLIENEFGEVGIDNELLLSGDEQIVEMNLKAFRAGYEYAQKHRK